MVSWGFESPSGTNFNLKFKAMSMKIGHLNRLTSKEILSVNLQQGFVILDDEIAAYYSIHKGIIALKQGVDPDEFRGIVGSIKRFTAKDDYEIVHTDCFNAGYWGE